MTANSQLQKEKSVQIPVSLFNDIIDFMDQVHFLYRDKNDSEITELHFSILKRLDSKVASISLRNAYSRIVHAKDDNERFDARINYLSKKRRLHG